MHHASAEFARVLATTVIPSVHALTLFKPGRKSSHVLGILFADSFDGTSLRRSIFPNAFDRVYIFMREYPLAVHRRILNLSLVVATVRKDDKGFVLSPKMAIPKPSGSLFSLKSPW
jgi:hypothetical protein